MQLIDPQGYGMGTTPGWDSRFDPLRDDYSTDQRLVIVYTPVPLYIAKKNLSCTAVKA